MAQAGIVHRPGMAKDLLAQLAPLLAADGIDLDNLGGAYRRMCGAGHADTPSVVAAVGLPPHARRRQGPAEARLEAEGPTAACAAPAHAVSRCVSASKAYRRMRGAGNLLTTAYARGLSDSCSVLKLRAGWLCPTKRYLPPSVRRGVLWTPRRSTER